MELALFVPTHGLGQRDEHGWRVQSTPVSELPILEFARQAERLGFHSLWFGDKIAPPVLDEYPYDGTAELDVSVYPAHPTILDGAVTMGAIAAVTERIRLAPAVNIAPYRGPLNDARQYATLDRLSNGRLIMGVGAGWLAEEFDALGLSHEDRGAMTEECIEIYKRAWQDDVVSFHGHFYDFENISMDPKPVQKPYPPIIFGSTAKLGARRAARLCDGFFPEFMSAYPDLHRFAPHQDEIRREAERLGRDLSDFWMICCQTVHVTDRSWSRPIKRFTCAGSADQILEDLERFAAAGFGLIACYFDCPSGTGAEMVEQLERFGTQVLPYAKAIQPAGEWKRDY